MFLRQVLAQEPARLPVQVLLKFHVQDPPIFLCIMSESSIPSLKITDFSEDVHCSTKLNYRTVGIRWTIANYDVICKTVELLKSSEFPEGEEQSQKWYLEFQPLKLTPDSKEIQEINLKRTRMGDLYVETLLCVETESNEIYKDSYAFELSNSQYVRYKPAVKELYNQLFKNKTADKSLIITCKVRIFDTTQPKTETAYWKNTFNTFEFFESSDLTQDISKFLLNDQAFQDVTISVGKKTFCAHKAILSTRSEVFQAMFTNEMSEKSNSLVEIDDLSPEVIKSMLHFIYTDKVDYEDLKKLAPELLGAAEKYNLRRLKKMCVAAMHRNLAVENILNTLKVADIYSIAYLKKEALKFLVTHHRAIKTQNEFKTLIAERPHLMIEFLDVQENILETLKKTS
ncbi:speckle-type POZ protein-like [Belonocnema kinseyi]|uniref:speckle-type POZ protein-like n=1 Tax=Belonocnema kinseyi TaxID=2817044 RepID=UPI00143D4E06|nr:speckle-type POZ protein-like [Belonocnema kinseyi]